MNNQNPLYLHNNTTCTSEALRIFPKKTDFEGLSADQKGCWYEGYVQYLLEMNDVNYIGNPVNFGAWKSNPTKGYDIIVTHPNGRKTKVECKMLLRPIYHSWFYKDWLSRDADIYITNDVYAVPYKCRKLLRERGKKLLSTTEFIMYVQKRIRGNKYSYLNISNSASKHNTSNKEQIIFSEINHPMIETLKEYSDFMNTISGDYQSWQTGIRNVLGVD